MTALDAVTSLLAALFAFDLLATAVGFLILRQWLQRIDRMVGPNPAEEQRYAALAVEAARLRRHRDQLQRDVATARRNVEGLEKLVAEKVNALVLERTINDLLLNVLTEISQQTAENPIAKSMPGTTLSVIEVAAAEAIKTVADWRETGQAELGEVTNARATLANALLPEPDRAHDLPGTRTERKRDGRVGDSAGGSRYQVDPDRFHLYDYGLRAAGPGHDGLECGVRGCGRHHGHPVHNDRGFSQTMTMASGLQHVYTTKRDQLHGLCIATVDGKECRKERSDSIHLNRQTIYRD